jgi:hypothetical protein
VVGTPPTEDSFLGIHDENAGMKPVCFSFLIHSIAITKPNQLKTKLFKLSCSFF